MPLNFVVAAQGFFVGLLPVLEDVAGLAVEGFADGLEGGEADGLGLARLEDGEVGLGDADTLGQFL